MSVTTSIPIPSEYPVTNAIQIKSIDIELNYPAEEKDIEEELYVAPAVDACDKEDSDYDPTDDKEEGIRDEEEDRKEREEAQWIENEENEANEAEDVNSDAFEKELNSALDNVLKIAQIDRKVILENARKEYKRETGEEATDEMIADAMKTFAIDDIDDEAAEIEREREICDVDPRVFRKEFEEALQVVRKVAKVDQERLVNTICDISNQLCNTEPEPQQISQIFGRIKARLADEAREEFLDLYEVDSENESGMDSDYDVTHDLNEDISEESDENESNINNDDDDYSPETDTFDYSQDIQDDKFESDEAENE